MGNKKNRGCEKYNEGNKRILKDWKTGIWTARTFKAAIKIK